MKPTKNKDSSRLGDIAEHYAITWLWDQGFDVFKNSGCTGPVDMISFDRENGDIVLIDVKTGNKDLRWPNAKKLWSTGYRTPLQKQLGVQILSFNPENRKLRFVGHKV
jgi:hypothetical protein